MMESKAWYTSKTAWLNIAALLSLALMLPEVGQLVPPGAAKYIGAFNAILNLALRFGGAGQAPLTMRKGPTIGLLLLLLLPFGAAGCATAPASRAQTVHRLALVSETYASTLLRLQAWEVSQHRLGVVADADHVVWQRRIERMAQAGKLANDAIRVASVAGVQAQARAILDVLDELVVEQVIRFTESQRMTATLILESLRTAVMIWSATLDARDVGVICADGAGQIYGTCDDFVEAN